MYPWNTEGASDGSRVSEENTQGGDLVAISHSPLSILTLSELGALWRSEQTYDTT